MAGEGAQEGQKNGEATVNSENHLYSFCINTLDMKTPNPSLTDIYLTFRGPKMAYFVADFIHAFSPICKLLVINNLQLQAVDIW